MRNTSQMAVFKWSVTVAGLALLAISLLEVPNLHVHPAVGIALALSLLVSPRFNITLPHAGATLSFSDVTIFLAFALNLSELAVALSATEVVASFIHLRSKSVKVRWSMLPFNLGMATLATGLTVLLLNSIQAGIGSPVDDSSLVGTAKVLMVAALGQFVLLSALTAAYYSLSAKTPLLESWKTNGLPLSITHFVGACFAGLVFIVWRSGDAFAAAGSVLVVSILYLSFRQIMANLSASIEAAGKAEQEKTEIERRRRLEVEQFASNLTTSLLKEEATTRALRESETAFRHAALHDALTRLPNRANFTQMLKARIELKRSGDSVGDDYVLLLDLSRFKSVNDTLGHSIGDRVLEIAARRFRNSISPDDEVARLGGDEFAIILKNRISEEQADEAVKTIRDKMSGPISVSGNRVNVGVNIGVAPLSPNYRAPEEALRDADIAMQTAARRGTGTVFFNEELRDESLRKAKTESDLPFAIENREFVLHYQPIVSLQDGSLIGAEALIRWNHPTRGMIPPMEFIPIAEETGLIIPLTSWILSEACETLASWHRSSPANRQLIVSVNISGRHLAHQSLVDNVRECLEDTGLDPECLKLEITESVAMENTEQSLATLNELKDLGVHLSIDDFGTGYSSLSQLHKMPFDTLKIDRSFVMNVSESGEGTEVLETIIALAKTLRMRVVAEGVETVAQLGLLRSLGCEYGQGYLMSKPVTSDEIARLMREKNDWLPRPALPTLVSAPEQIPERDNVLPF